MGDDHFPQRVSGTAAAQKSDLHGRWVSQRLNPRLSGWNTIHLAFLEVTRCKSIVFNFGMFWHEFSIIFRIYSITFNLFIFMGLHPDHLRIQNLKISDVTGFAGKFSGTPWHLAQAQRSRVNCAGVNCSKCCWAEESKAVTSTASGGLKFDVSL